MKEDFNAKTSFLKPLWWLIHLIGISLVYTLGVIWGG